MKTYYLLKSLKMTIISLLLMFIATGCIFESKDEGNNGILALLFGSKKKVEAPVLTPVEGTYSNDISVSISCPTDGASIYFTMDGSTPSESSIPYTVPIGVLGNGTVVNIQAIAVHDDMSDSEVVSATYTIDYDQVSTPQFDPIEDTYDHDIDVSISCSTSDVQIYYTTDGSTPDAGSTLYSSPISIAGHETNMTIKAIAMKAGMEDSTVASAEYTIEYTPVETPVFNPVEGTYDHDLSVEISCPTSGATIYYTTDGSTPTTSSSEYSSGIPISGHETEMTIKAIAVKSGMAQSEVASADYVINYAQVSTPQMSPIGQTLDHDVTVSITCSTSGATIHYTTDGSTPDASSPVYGSPIPVAGHGTTMTIQAMAIASGMLDSEVAIHEYTIEYSPVATPTITSTMGTTSYVFKNEYIFISCATDGATIYYTTDGSEPTTSSTQYTSSIPASGLDASTTVKAIAVKDGMLDSAIGSKSYTIEQNDVYISGQRYSAYSGDPIAYYWKNGNYVSTSLSYGTKSYARSITMSGDDVYVGGYWFTTGSDKVACYWKTSGETTTRWNLASGSRGAEVKDITVVGTTVYTTGYHYEVNPSVPSYLDEKACYWINDVRYEVTTEHRSQGNGIAVSGSDVYVVGWIEDLSSDQVACYWINGTRYDLDVPMGTTISSASDIAISGSDVYISGNYYNGSWYACYWLNGVRVDLGSTNAERAKEIALLDTDVYMLESGCYYLNTTKHNLSDAPTGISIVGSDVYIVGVDSWYDSYYDEYHFRMVLYKNGLLVRYYSDYGDITAESIHVDD